MSRANISQVVSQSLCLKCGACYTICHKDAIQFSIEKTGDKKPVANRSQCISCKQCLTVCPGKFPIYDREETTLGNVYNSYIGYAADSNIRKTAASGGIITALNIHLLEKGIVDGVISVRQHPDNIYENQVILATTREDILSAKGSRYAPVFLLAGLKDMKLQKGKTYALVGKPCDIQALTKYKKLTKEYNFIKIAIFCAHTPPMSATKKAVAISSVKENQVKNIHYRGEGWPGYFRLLSEKGDTLFKREYPEIWGPIFCSTKSYEKRCYFCHDCTGEQADISVGDAWLDEYMGSSDGHSVIVTRNERGDTLIKDSLKEKKLILEETESAIVAKSQKSLLGKKQNIFLKRLISWFMFTSRPEEKSSFKLKDESLKEIPGIVKFFIKKAINR